MNYAACTTPTKDSKVVVRENKSRFEVLNSDRVEIKKVQVDGCLITDNTKEKCDWIIQIDNAPKKVMYIELKGCGIDKAISQLKATLNHTKAKYQDFSKECYAVTTRIPKHGTSTRKMCIDFHKATRVPLSVKNRVTTVTV